MPSLLLVVCSFTNQVLAQLDVWKYWKETTAYKNDRHLLPKDLDGGVAKLSLLHSVRALTVLTQTQADCANVKVEGPFKRGVFLLTGVIAVVLLRTLHRDTLKYIKLATAEDAAERRAGNSFTLTSSGNLIIPSCLQYVSVRVFGHLVRA